GLASDWSSDVCSSDLRPWAGCPCSMSAPHWNLGGALIEHGQLAEGLAMMERGHRLGARPPKDDAGEVLQDARRLVALEAKLTGGIGRAAGRERERSGR